MEDKGEISAFYARKSVLITGATGFIGKVLIWKLLYSCPLIDKIYILVRPKRGNDSVMRRTDLIKCPVSTTLVIFLLPL